MIACLAASVFLLHPSPLLEMDAAGDPAPAGASPAPATAVETLEQLCPRLLELAHSVDARLRTVTDRASADEAAGRLDQDMAEMIRILRQIEKLPPHTAVQAQMLTAHMSDLTHLAQGYNTVAQRIIEVNAYGSESMLQTLSKYKVMGAGGSLLTSTASPKLSRLEEMGDAAEDILYVLRRIKCKEDAQNAMKTLPRRTVQLNSARSAFLALPPGISSDQREALERGMQRMRQLHRALESELLRLRSSGFYEAPALEVICQDSINTVKSAF